MSDEDKEINQNKNEEKKGVGLKPNLPLKIIKICIIFVIILTTLFICKIFYEKYIIYEFQKRYNEAPIGSIVETGRLNYPRSRHSSIKLRNNNILIVGGNIGAELFNPITGQYNIITKDLPPINGSQQNSILLPNGNVLVAGYFLYDANKNAFIKVNNVNQYIQKEFLNYNAPNFIMPILLNDEKVLVILDFPSKDYYRFLLYDIKENSYSKFDINIPEEYKKNIRRGLRYVKNEDFIYFISGIQIIKWNYKENKFIDIHYLNKNWQQVFALNTKYILLSDGMLENNSAIYNIENNVLTMIDGFDSIIYKIFATNKDFYIFTSTDKNSFEEGKNNFLRLFKFNLDKLNYEQYKINKYWDYYKYGYNYIYSFQSICQINENSFLLSGGQFLIPDSTNTNKSYILKIGEQK